MPVIWTWPRSIAIAKLPSTSTFIRRGPLSVCLQATVNKRHLCIDYWVVQPLLSSDELHKLVSAFDVERAILQRTRRRCWAHEALRRRSVFLEWN
jgi:hypothetical protein